MANENSKQNRVRDIKVPSDQNERTQYGHGIMPAKKKKGKSASFLKGFLVLVGMVALGLLAIHFLFSTATIHAWPESRTVSSNEAISVRSDASEVDTVERIIPGTYLESTTEATDTYKSTATDTSDARASGTIRIYNETSSAMPLLPQTRFTSDSGYLFRMPERVVVPGATEGEGGMQPGTVEVEIVAAESGEDYNIEPASFSLTGLSGTELYTQIYARSEESMTGGETNEVMQISEDDVENAQDAIIEVLTNNAREELGAELSDGFELEAGSIHISNVEYEMDDEVGDMVDEFDLSASADVSAIAFRPSDVHRLANEYLIAQAGEDEFLDEESVNISYNFGTLDRDTESITMQMSAEATSYYDMNTVDLRGQIRGMSGDEAEGLLGSNTNLSRAHVTFWPFWVNKIPDSMGRITVDVNFE